MTISRRHRTYLYRLRPHGVPVGTIDGIPLRSARQLEAAGLLTVTNGWATLTEAGNAELDSAKRGRPAGKPEERLVTVSAIVTREMFEWIEEECARRNMKRMPFVASVLSAGRAAMEEP